MIRDPETRSPSKRERSTRRVLRCAERAGPRRVTRCARAHSALIVRAAYCGAPDSRSARVSGDSRGAASPLRFKRKKKKEKKNNLKFLREVNKLKNVNTL
jgi:hypothetical protein